MTSTSVQLDKDQHGSLVIDGYSKAWMKQGGRKSQFLEHFKYSGFVTEYFMFSQHSE